MTEIFVSYSQKDVDRITPLVDALKQEGYEVWWDLEIRAGEFFDHVIEKRLKQVNCVLAVWSQRSVESHWVRAETAWAKDNEKLVSIQIDKELELPVKFYNVHTRNMADWTGKKNAPEFIELIADIHNVTDLPLTVNEIGSSSSLNQKVPTSKVLRQRDFLNKLFPRSETPGLPLAIRNNRLKHASRHIFVIILGLALSVVLYAALFLRVTDDKGANQGDEEQTAASGRLDRPFYELGLDRERVSPENSSLQRCLKETSLNARTIEEKLSALNDLPELVAELRERLRNVPTCSPDAPTLMREFGCLEQEAGTIATALNLLKEMGYATPLSYVQLCEIKRERMKEDLKLAIGLKGRTEQLQREFARVNGCKVDFVAWGNGQAQNSRIWQTWLNRFNVDLQPAEKATRELDSQLSGIRTQLKFILQWFEYRQLVCP